jgi:membrane protease YdiL (CAAX protease family)
MTPDAARAARSRLPWSGAALTRRARSRLRWSGTAFTRCALSPFPSPGAAFTRRGPSAAPRRGSVADPESGRAGLSTAPGGGAVAPGIGWVVVGGGLAFLLGRPGLHGLPSGLPLLLLGYLVLGGAALVVREGDADRSRGAPLGTGVTLGIGVAAVLAAGVVAGPGPDRRVGMLAGGIAVVAGVVEEALFRRVLYDRLLRFGVVVAVGGTAVVFALVHLPAYGVAAMPVDLGAALLLSWQRYASGRWTVPAVTHAVANLLAVT